MNEDKNEDEDPKSNNLRVKITKMEFLQSFVETCCIRSPEVKIETRFLYDKFIEFLKENHNIDNSGITPTNFTFKLKKSLQNYFIPGDISKPIEYTRESKALL